MSEAMKPDTNQNTKMKTIQSEFNTAIQSINPEWAVETGPYAGNYKITTGADEDGDPIYSDCPEEIIEGNFEKIACMDTEDEMGGFLNSTYRITDNLVMTIDDNDNHFWLTDKTDEEIIAELKTSYDA
jgi:hypothetical protein